MARRRRYWDIKRWCDASNKQGGREFYGLEGTRVWGVERVMFCQNGKGVTLGPGGECTTRSATRGYGGEIYREFRGQVGGQEK